jgi:hypothetical protein
MKPYAFCAEEIQDAAVVRKHCGRDMKTGASQVQLVAPKKKKTGCLALGLRVAASRRLLHLGSAKNWRNRQGDQSMSWHPTES